MRIILNDEERRLVKVTAWELASFWEHQSFEATYAGLAAELAVIKFINGELGAMPPLEFNTRYINGGDGGSDFKLAPGDTFDVKSWIEDAQLNHVKRTKAKYLVGVFKDGNTYNIRGFAPAATFDGHWINIFKLKEVWPRRFAELAPGIPKNKRRPERVSDLIPSVLVDVERWNNKVHR